jgi:hypothetical protein
MTTEPSEPRGRYHTGIEAMKMAAIEMTKEVGIIKAAEHWGVDKSMISRWAKQRGVTFTGSQKNKRELSPCGTLNAYRRGCKCDLCRAANTAHYTNGRAAREAKLATDPTSLPHGTTSTYCNYGCRCDPCKEAQAKSNAFHAARRKGLPITGPHGVLSTYTNWGCRCDLCRKAMSDENRSRYTATH